MNHYIKWIQETLVTLGYDPGVIDGINGPHTQKAIIAFQQYYNLVVDGMVGSETHHFLMKGLKDAKLNPEPIVLKNFTHDEFDCICGCGLDVVDRLKVFAQELRDHFGWPLIITSGGRCPPVNREEGGVMDSCHLNGEAFDCYLSGHMNTAVMAQIADFAVNKGFGVIRYPNQLFCHFQIYPRDTFIY